MAFNSEYVFPIIFLLYYLITIHFHNFSLSFLILDRNLLDIFLLPGNPSGIRKFTLDIRWNPLFPYIIFASIYLVK